MSRVYIIIIVILFQGCTQTPSENGEATRSENLLNAINSAGVAFSYSGDHQQDFFKNPNRGYVSGYFYFEEDLANDIIFGLDMEWLEGVDDPVNFEGGDWMSLAGFTREGILWFPIGSPENLEGEPTDTEIWESRDLGELLKPETWYKMTITSDFGAREFQSVELQGGGLDTLIDLSGFPLEYPNFVPFDNPSLTFYMFALRSKEFAPKNHGGFSVFFDDIKGGIWINGNWEVVFSNGFESQNQILDIPFTLPVSPRAIVQENFWYFENEHAKINITDINSRSGTKSMECHADLRDTNL